MDFTLSPSRSESPSASVSSPVNDNDMTADVPPGGRVDVPTENDVLCGRGGSINSHLGNENFRLLVEKRKRVYLTARFKREKRLIASSICIEIRQMDPPGRFLAKKGGKDGHWYDIGDEKARDKTSQALRENAPTIRAEIETEINQQRKEMKRKEVDVDEGSPKQPPSYPPPPPPPPPPHAYYQQYWDYYYSYYGYPPHGVPPPPHGVHPGPPPPPPHGVHPGPPPPPHGVHPGPPPPSHGVHPGLPPPSHGVHPGLPPPSHGVHPGPPPPTPPGYHHPPPPEGYWGMPPPPPREGLRPPGQEEFKDEDDDVLDLDLDMDKTSRSQEDRDHELAVALQEQQNLEAVEARRKRQIDPNHARSARGCAQYFGTNPLPVYDSKRLRTGPSTPVAAAAASGPIKQESSDAQLAHLTQEQRDHRMAVAMQDQEDNAIRYRREASEDTSRRTSRSNAYSQAQRVSRDEPTSAFDQMSLHSNFFSFGGHSNSENDKKPAAFKTEQDAYSSPRRAVQFKSGHGGRPASSSRFDGTILPPAPTFGQDIAYQPVDFQSQDNMLVGNPKDQQLQAQSDAVNSSLLSQVANHILGGFGSWDTNHYCANELSGGTPGLPRSRSGSSQQPRSVTSRNPRAERNMAVETEGHEVQLVDFRDESDMPPPEPRVQIDWPSRVGSCHSWIPETIGAGAASLFGGQTQTHGTRGSQHSFTNYGISPVNSLEMDISATGTEQFSCAGSVGGGSLCQVFDPADPEGLLASSLNHRVLQQVPSWERSMRSKSPLSTCSVEEDDDVMIRVRGHDKNYDKSTSFGHTSRGHDKPIYGLPMTPIRDEDSAVRSQPSPSTDMDWEDESQRLE
jgi:hypothetical protein